MSTAGGPVDVGEVLGRQQLAAVALENVEKSVLVRLNDDAMLGTPDLEIGQNHLLRGVKIPAIARGGLVVPGEPAAIGVQRDDRRGVETVQPGRTQLAKVVGRRVRGAEIHQFQFRVVGETVPGGAAQLERRIARGIPRLGGRRQLRVLEGLPDGRRHGVEAPFESTGFQVVRRHVAADAAVPHVGARVADHDLVAGDLRRAGAGVRQLVIGDGVGLPDLLAGGRIDRMQASVSRGDIDLPPSIRRHLG